MATSLNQILDIVDTACDLVQGVPFAASVIGFIKTAAVAIRTAANNSTAAGELRVEVALTLELMKRITLAVGDNSIRTAWGEYEARNPDEGEADRISSDKGCLTTFKEGKVGRLHEKWLQMVRRCRAVLSPPPIRSIWSTVRRTQRPG